MPPSVKPAACSNALTVDVEDWIQSVLDRSHPLTDCFLKNTHRVLELLDHTAARATFFVLGLAARRAPELIREIASAGHEVASHGYDHAPVWEMTPSQFCDDAGTSKKLLEDILGLEVTGYRAPAFSIDERNAWAIDVLAECGFRFDSSLFPVRMRRYGMAGIPRHPHRLLTAGGLELIEFPVASLQVAGRRIPAGGGGYLRLFPAGLIRSAIRQLNADGKPGVLYMHPYELAPGEFATLPARVPWSTRIQQGAGRRGFERKLDSILRQFDFHTIGDLSAAMDHLPVVFWPGDAAERCRPCTNGRPPSNDTASLCA